MSPKIDTDATKADRDLGDLLRGLPDPESPLQFERLKARLASQRPTRRRRWVPAAIGGLAVAAATTLVVLPATPETRDKGLASAPAVQDVGLTASAEDAQGRLRPLNAGDSVGPDERVVFGVQTTQAGHLVLLDLTDNTRVYPAPGTAWQVHPGLHAPGGASPLSYRPDGPRSAGPVRYGVFLCQDPPTAAPEALTQRCSSAELMLRWAR